MWGPDKKTNCLGWVKRRALQGYILWGIQLPQYSRPSKFQCQIFKVNEVKENISAKRSIRYNNYMSIHKIRVVLFRCVVNYRMPLAVTPTSVDVIRTCVIWHYELYFLFHMNEPSSTRRTNYRLGKYGQFEFYFNVQY